MFLRILQVSLQIGASFAKNSRVGAFAICITLAPMGTYWGLFKGGDLFCKIFFGVGAYFRVGA